MSSILKALKKLEEEKVRLHGGAPDIARDILRSPHRRKRGAPGMTIIAVCLSVALVCVAGYVFWNEMAASVPTSMERAPAPPPREVTSPRTPAVDESRAMEKLPVRRQVIDPAIGEPLPKEEGSGQAAHQAEKKATVETPISAPSKAALKIATPATPPNQKSSPAREEIPATSPPREEAPKLVLSGIAFQVDRESRMAIINDLPVMEGMRIEGVLIEEIFKDRVRVSSDDRTFELTMEEGPQ